MRNTCFLSIYLFMWVYKCVSTFIYQRANESLEEGVSAGI